MTRTTAAALVLLLASLAPGVRAQVDPEVGANDFQISFAASANNPVVLYHPARNEYLAAWYSPDDFDTVIQRLDSLGGLLGDPVPLGLGYISRLRIAHDPINDRHLITAVASNVLAAVLVDSSGAVGPPRQISGLAHFQHGLAFNADRQEYLLVFNIEDRNYSRRVDADGQPMDLGDTPLETTTTGVGSNPRVAYNSAAKEYLVVWLDLDPPADGSKVWVRRLSGASGLPVAGTSVISSIDSSNFLGADAPQVAYNPIHDEYLVVWVHKREPHENDGNEVFGQRLNGLGAEIGIDDFQISTMGSAGNNTASAKFARIAFNSRRNRYLVTWIGDDQSAGMVNNEYEVFGQYLARGGSRLDPKGFRISDIGGTGDPNFGCEDSSLAYNPDRDEFLSVFSGRDLPGVGVRIFGQRLHGAPTIFSDGFETGSDRNWSSSTP